MENPYPDGVVPAHLLHMTRAERIAHFEARLQMIMDGPGNIAGSVGIAGIVEKIMAKVDYEQRMLRREGHSAPAPAPTSAPAPARAPPLSTAPARAARPVPAPAARRHPTPPRGPSPPPPRTPGGQSGARGESEARSESEMDTEDEFANADPDSFMEPDPDIDPDTEYDETEEHREMRLAVPVNGREERERFKQFVCGDTTLCNEGLRLTMAEFDRVNELNRRIRRDRRFDFSLFDNDKKYTVSIFHSPLWLSTNLEHIYF